MKKTEKHQELVQNTDKLKEEVAEWQRYIGILKDQVNTMSHLMNINTQKPQNNSKSLQKILSCQ